MSTSTAAVEVQQSIGDEQSQKVIKPKHERDSNYYFQDDPMAIFLVEGRLFKVHRHYLLEGSEVFRNLFASPKEEGVEPDGTSDERPITLPGVTAKEFEALLDYFYAQPHQWEGSKNEKRLENYLDLLSVSHRFIFENAFRYTLKKIKPMAILIPAIQRFQLGEKYNLREWLLSAYESLLNRPAPLSAEEAEALGIARVVRYMGAREMMHNERMSVKVAELERERKLNDPNLALPAPAPRGAFSFAPAKVVSLSIPIPPVSETKKLVEKFFF
ncbi:hypothetical protein P691DRAFT_703406 [Macrolepiota fuliginosa MF-IS2]|uniref:BTB domain-containing protein n=1 Tax=Macrolepiota fuliginosa MF-IS2 TaxID=1400762 RepID=A0A9P6C292_9AGAR|nr:hypothetical protein P691DRAFT_703406 [Macrolepiota fuliginosa MF-IS2]